MGGVKSYPSYNNISLYIYKHYECVKVLFDNSLINYNYLLRYFFSIHDPSSKDKQGLNGYRYRSVVL